MSDKFERNTETCVPIQYDDVKWYAADVEKAIGREKSISDNVEPNTEPSVDELRAMCTEADTFQSAAIKRLHHRYKMSSFAATPNPHVFVDSGGIHVILNTRDEVSSKWWRGHSHITILGITYTLSSE